jgi:hypothetical protein
MKNFAILLALATTMVACKKKFTQADLDAANASGYSAGQTEAEGRAIKAANFLAELQEANPSLDYDIVKFGKDNANYVVLSYDGTYAAIDISQYTTGTDALTYIFSGVGVYDNLTANGDGTYSCVAGTCTGVSGPTSSTMVFENTTSSVKDLEKAAAFIEAHKVESLASSLSAQFGLSEERATTVAKLASSFEKLSKSRALTNADADAFSKELAGVSIAEMESAYKSMTEGSTSELNAVLEIAAEVNGTTSENMAVIMNKLFF